MSELIQKNDRRIRWHLLTGVSALALTAYVSSADVARAEDVSHPQIWIELGGQFNRLEDGQEAFAPVFPGSPARPSIFSPSQKFEKPPLFDLDEDGKISFHPEDSDWMFSAAIRYGRSSSNRHVRQQTSPNYFYISRHYYGKTIRYTARPVAARFADTLSSNSEHHLILDFQAGKDVGLGMFGGKDGSSTVSLGVRFAQFRSQSNITLKSDPDFQFSYKYNPIVLYFGFTKSKLVSAQPYHSNAATLRAARSFRGVGPSISWNGSAPFAGNPQDGEIALDWGVNAALLFGRQLAKVAHHATGQYGDGHTRHVIYQPAPVSVHRTRSVSVPNLDGFAGISFGYADAKISFGYRADFFFGAMDGGIDARKSEDRGFFGPFASVSVGLGN